MRSPEAIQQQRMQALVSPGRVGDASTSGRGAAAGQPITAPQYVSWSGAVATVHKRLILGLSNYGLGSELS